MSCGVLFPSWEFLARLATVPVRSRWFSLTTLDVYDAIHARAGKSLPLAIMPTNLDRLDAFDITQSKVGFQIVAALKALTGLNLSRHSGEIGYFGQSLVLSQC